MMHLRLGLRGSAVSLRHVGRLSDFLHERHPDVRVELQPVSSRGRSESTALVVDGLRGGEFDAVWVNMREIVWPLPEDVILAACLRRMNPRMGLLHHQGVPFANLPKGTRLDASDDISRAQLASARPDIVWTKLTGDLPTRLHKVHLRQADGLVEAASDLLIIGLDEHTIEFLSTEVVLPPPGQGAWGVCCMREREDVRALVAPLDHADTRLCVTAEHGFRAALGMPEDVPVAVWCRMQRGKLVFNACVVHPEKNAPVRLSVSGPPTHRDELIRVLVEMYAHQGIGKTRARSSRR